MIQEERSEAISRILRKRKVVSIAELCELLYCSKSTVHRDLIRLEKSGLVRRTRGGVTLAADRSVELPTDFRRLKNQDKKEEIADLCQRYLENDSLIFLDASTTVKALIPYIIRLSNVSIVSNSISMASELGQYEQLQVLIPSGRIYAGHDAILGMQTLSSLEGFYFDVAFFSCKSIDHNGVYEAEYEQALIKKSMLKQARRSILLCDSSKIGSSSFFNYAKVADFDVIISDKGLDHSGRDMLGSKLL